VPTFIDFTRSRHNVNAPQMRISGPLNSLVVYNIGPGLVYYFINMAQNEEGTAAVPAGVQPGICHLPTREAIFKTLNLRTVGSDATVDLTMESASRRLKIKRTRLGTSLTELSPNSLRNRESSGDVLSVRLIIVSKFAVRKFLPINILF
jgi:hypothetical protein